MTAIEWLLNELISEPYTEKDFDHNSKAWDQALEYEKQQIEQAYFDGTCFEENGFSNNPSQYYKVNYLKDKL